MSCPIRSSVCSSDCQQGGFLSVQWGLNVCRWFGWVAFQFWVAQTERSSWAKVLFLKWTKRLYTCCLNLLVVWAMSELRGKELYSNFCEQAGIPGFYWSLRGLMSDLELVWPGVSMSSCLFVPSLWDSTVTILAFTYNTAACCHICIWCEWGMCGSSRLPVTSPRLSSWAL